MEIIQNSIKCFHCRLILDTPVLLPCGESICQNHTQINDTDFPCSACGSNHPIPPHGFIRMKALENIIRTQIEKLNLGKEHDEALRSCQQLDSILNEITLLRNDPNFYINASINQIRNDVDIKREELKLKIDQEANRIVTELNEYEEDCKRNWANSNFKTKLEEIEKSVQDTRLKLASWMAEFKTIDLNEQKWKEIKQGSDEIILSLNQRVNTLKQELLLDRLKEYQIKPIEFNEIDINSKKLRSKILTTSQKVDLFSLCKLSFDQDWKLLYRGSEDGFAANKFHFKCDNKPSTLTMIKSSAGYIFGGYTDSIWDQSNTYKTDSNAFLFSLTNKENRPVLMNIIPGKETLAIYGAAVSGPRFGGGSDLVISDNANSNNNSFTNLGHSFKHPFYAHGTNDVKFFMAGTYNFQVFEIEVFQKI